MIKVFKYFERFMIWSILLVISIILILAFIDIVYEIVGHLLNPPVFIIDASGLMDLFSLFLLLLIGLELFETVRAYLKEDIVHVEFIILVTIIAISRKVIIWDFNQYSMEELLSLSGMILALGVTYFLIKRADWRIRVNRPLKTEEKKKGEE